MKSFFFLFVFGISYSVYTQHLFERAIEIRPKVGFLAAHRGVMAHMPRSIGLAGEISYVFRSRGNKEYQKFYKYPNFGFTLFYGSVGNQELMGNYQGIYGFTELPLIVYKKYRMDFKLGCGMGYTSKVYDPISNIKNVAVSTHINGMMCMGIKSSYFFGLNCLTLGLDISHFSNAAFKVPNYGINMPYISLGYARTLTAIEKESVQVSPMMIPYKKWLFSATGILSVKQMMPVGGNFYPVYAANGSAKRFFNHRSGLELNVDLISKQAIFSYLPYIQKTQLDIIQVGLFAGYLVPLDRFHFVFGMGGYVRDKYQPEDALYHRIGCRYQLQNGLLLNFTLKTHWARADYLEWGVGYTFNYKKK